MNQEWKIYHKILILLYSIAIIILIPIHPPNNGIVYSSKKSIVKLITFYDDFHLDRSPPAIKICAAEGCQASGARDLLERARGQFEDAVEEVFCLGNCALGPCAMVGETVVAQADTTRLADLLEKQTDS